MDKALILAAGRGTRMEGLTEDRPKPMIDVGGKPLLEHILDRLRDAGFSSALVVTGYKAEMIETAFPNHPMRMEFVRQHTIEGTARAALLARDWAADAPFLMTYGDILTDVEDYRGMAAKLQPGVELVLSVKWVDDPWQGAAVYADDAGRILRIVEKPSPGTSTTNWNSAGCYVFRPSIFDTLARVERSPRGEYEVTSAVELELAAGHRAVIHAHQGGWRDVGRPSDLEVAGRLV
jgi:NDP-sugar pyrophosphorylase family protein